MRKMMNVVQMRDDIYKMIIDCQNLLSEKKLPVWFAKDMLEYTKVLASQLALSGSQKLAPVDYSYLRENIEELLLRIKNIDEENIPITML